MIAEPVSLRSYIHASSLTLHSSGTRPKAGEPLNFTLGPTMTVELVVFQKVTPRSLKTFAEVEKMAQLFLVSLNQAEVQERIARVHQLGVSSAEVQMAILPCAEQLGFLPEKKGLF